MHFKLALQGFEDLQAAFAGIFGEYRVKCILGLLVSSEIIPSSILHWYPVASSSGTAATLNLLYQYQHSGEEAAKSLVHLYHQVPSRRGHNLASLELVCCGWHRSKQRVNLHGRIVDGLQRAVELEEEGFLLYESRRSA